MSTKSLLIVLLFTILEIKLYSQNCNLGFDNYANIHTIGVNITLPFDDIDFNAKGTLQYKKSTDVEWKDGFDLSRVQNEFKQLSGSIFWCSSNTTYDIKVTVTDETDINDEAMVCDTFITTQKNIHYASAIKTYYVSPTGNGVSELVDEPGDLETTLGSLEWGNKLVLLEGEYFVGDLTFSESGIDEYNPIQIVGEEGAEVVLNGAQEATLNWIKFNNNDIYWAKTEELNPNLVVVNGKRLYPHVRYTDLKNSELQFGLESYDLSMNGFFRNPSVINSGADPFFGTVNFDPKRIYINLTLESDPNPNNLVEDVIVTRFKNAFNLSNQNNIIFQNLIFENYGLAHSPSAVNLVGCSNITFANCQFNINDSGIRLSKNTNNVLVENCSFYGGFPSNFYSWVTKSTGGENNDLFPSNVIFANNARALERGGITVASDFEGRGIIIKECDFNNYNQAGGIVPSGDVFGNQGHSLELDFYNNTVSDVTGDGMEIEQHARNVRIWGNTFKKTHVALSMAPAQDGPIYILRNSFIDMEIDSTKGEVGVYRNDGSTLKFQYGNESNINNETNTSTADIFYFHNTTNNRTEAPGMEYSHVAANESIRNLVAKNNIFQSSIDSPLKIRTLGMQNITSDYNCYYSTSFSGIAKVDTSDIGYWTIETLDDVFNILGWEENSLNVTPTFIDTAADDYHLEPTSLLVDKGVIIKGINDYIQKPDIGRYETEDIIISTNTYLSEQYLVYPNPSLSSQGFLIELPKILVNNEAVMFAIYDINGRLVKKDKFEANQQSISINNLNLASGTYVLTLIQKDKMYSQKIVLK